MVENATGQIVPVLTIDANNGNDDHGQRNSVGEDNIHNSSQWTEKNLEHKNSGSSGYSSSVSHVSSHELGKIPSCQEEFFQHENVELQGYLLAFDDWMQTQRAAPYPGLGYMSQTGTFAGAFFDESGGYLSLPRYGVSMFVPCGAIAKKLIQKLYLFIDASRPPMPCPVDGARWQSHILHCGPPGSKFQSDIVLKFPQGVTDKPFYEVGACRSSSDVDDWKNLESPRDALVTSHGGLVTIMIDHFSRYASYILLLEADHDDEVGSESLIAGVFMRRVPSETHAAVQLHVVLWSASKEAQVLRDESLLGARLCDRPRVFRIHHPGHDIIIYNGVHSTDGNIVRHEKVIKIDAILEELRDSQFSLQSPSVTFAALSYQNPPDPFMSTVVVTQKDDFGHDVDTVQFLVLPPSGDNSCDCHANAEVNSAAERRAQYKAVGRISTPNTSFRISQSDLHPPTEAYAANVLSTEEFTHLAEVLTREDPRGIGDWRSFADACGLRPYYQVEERAAHQGKSPGTLVLTYFLANCGPQLGRVGTLKKLLGVLRRCHIEQAISLVKRWLGVKNSEDSVLADQDQIQCNPQVSNDSSSKSAKLRQDNGTSFSTETEQMSDSKSQTVNDIKESNDTSSAAGKKRNSMFQQSDDTLSDQGLGHSIDPLSPSSSRSNSVGDRSSWILIQPLSLTD